MKLLKRCKPISCPYQKLHLPAPEASGARGNVSPALQSFLLGGTAVDAQDPNPQRLAPQVNSVDADDTALFPVGTTQVTFRFRDNAGNIGAATASVTVNPPIGGAADLGGVPINPTDPNNLPLPLEVTFAGVTQPGLLVATPVLAPPPAPAGFQFQGMVYDITTTALFTPPIEVCILGSGFRRSSLIFHFENGAWVDRTSSQTSTQVCATVSSLSPFGVVAPLNNAPSANAGADQTVEASSVSGAQVSLSGTGSDPDGDPLSFTWSGPFGTLTGANISPVLPSGTHTLTLTVEDGRGGTATDTVIVVVRDTTPPKLTLSANITVNATSAAGAVVNYIASANDAVDGARPVTCTPLCGSTFPVGSTTVNCSSSDTRGNSSSGSFTVTVQAQSGGMPAPVLTLLTPASGKRGTDLMLYVSGRNIRAGATLQISGTGVQAISFTRISDTFAISYVRIAGDAATGARQVTVTTSGGVSNSLSFTVQ